VAFRVGERGLGDYSTEKAQRLAARTAGHPYCYVIQINITFVHRGGQADTIFDPTGFWVAMT
jgi:hypothetical protein